MTGYNVQVPINAVISQVRTSPKMEGYATNTPFLTPAENWLIVAHPETLTEDNMRSGISLSLVVSLFLLPCLSAGSVQKSRHDPVRRVWQVSSHASDRGLNRFDASLYELDGGLN